MKVAAIALPLAALVAIANAADCTAADQEKMRAGIDTETFKTKCATITNALDYSQYCKDPTCAEVLQQMLENAPDCTVGTSGKYTLKQSMEAAIKACSALASYGDVLAKKNITLTPSTTKTATTTDNTTTTVPATTTAAPTTAAATAKPSSSAMSLGGVGAAAVLGVAATWWMADA